MTENTKILLVGGATRNVGKTTLTTNIIRQFCQSNKLVGIKIKTIYPNDSFFHGKDRNPLQEDEKYRITEEKSKSNIEDTNKMLVSGAKKVFKIKARAKYLLEAYNQIKNLIPENYLWVVESNSLRDFVIPGVFLLIKHKDKNEIKPSAQKLQVFADKIILTDGEKHFFNTTDLYIENNTWHIIK